MDVDTLQSSSRDLRDTQKAVNGEAGGSEHHGDNSNENGGNVPKGEVGWYFVEQYYTTMSRSPEKLHLFYNKRSQFVSGVETEKVEVSVGQRAINERIKESDIQDCKVRVTNVDSQESYKNLVVQVIGEMSNRAAPLRKFVQTFVLAEQPNGYFVLNDIFRYLNDTDDVLDAEIATEEPMGLDQSNKIIEELSSPNIGESPATQHEVETDTKDTNEHAAHIMKSPQNLDTPTNGNHPIDTPVEGPNADLTAPGIPKSLQMEEDSQGLGELDLETPQEPTPTPVLSPPKPSSPNPVKAARQVPIAKPAAPKTWANLVAANRGTPSPAKGNPVSVQIPISPKVATQNTDDGNLSNTAQVDESLSLASLNPSAGWQMAGQDGSKAKGRQPPNSVLGSGEKGTVSGYVKNVTERVDASILKELLSSFGSLSYFDVSRQKNCAFVEFSSADGYNAAVASNPHSIGGEQVYVEERRPRHAPYAPGFGSRANVRGGRGSSESAKPNGQSRGGFGKDAGRSTFVRGRGGATANRTQGTGAST
ncbi:hypothetical protein MMC25_002872 [Agyrium rufum]|nr:hypothetical protein [Agyrium rufum]